MPGPPSQLPSAASPTPAYQAPPPTPEPQPYAAPPPPPAQSSYSPPPPSYSAPPKKKGGNTGCIIAIVVVLILGCCAIVGFSFMPVLVDEILPEMFGTPTPDYYNPTSVPPTTGGGEWTEIWVQNNLDEAICYLYISPADSLDWGDDWLESYGTIPAGSYATFPIESGQTVDLMVEDCSGNQLDVQYDVYIYPEGLTYTLDPIQ